MIRLQIQLFGRLGVNLGQKLDLEFKNSPTIREVIQSLIEKDPTLKHLLIRNNDLSQGTILLLNGHVIDRSRTGLGLNTKLTPKDQLTVDRLGFLEIVGGG
jgi:hypothetical protein